MPAVDNVSQDRARSDKNLGVLCRMPFTRTTTSLTSYDEFMAIHGIHHRLHDRTGLSVEVN